MKLTDPKKNTSQKVKTSTTIENDEIVVRISFPADAQRSITGSTGTSTDATLNSLSKTMSSGGAKKRRTKGRKCKAKKQKNTRKR